MTSWRGKTPQAPKGWADDDTSTPPKVVKKPRKRRTKKPDSGEIGGPASEH